MNGCAGRPDRIHARFSFTPSGDDQRVVQNAGVGGPVLRAECSAVRELPIPGVEDNDTIHAIEHEETAHAVMEERNRPPHVGRSSPCAARASEKATVLAKTRTE